MQRCIDKGHVRSASRYLLRLNSGKQFHLLESNLRNTFHTWGVSIAQSCCCRRFKYAQLRYFHGALRGLGFGIMSFLNESF